MTKRSKISPEVRLWADLNELKAKNPEALEARIAAKRAAHERKSGALGMLGSDHASGERAAAVLQVERFRAKLGKQWRDLIK